MNVKTGLPIPAFGNNGIVDLTKQLEPDANFNTAIGHLMNTSPPLVSHDVIVIRTSLENGRIPKSMTFPKADIMAFDVRTGKNVWTFHTIPRPRIRRRYVAEQLEHRYRQHRSVGTIPRG